MPSHTIHIRVRGEEWAALFASRHPLLTRSIWGRCDPASRILVVRGSIRGMSAIDTAIHEFTHAYFPDLAEDSVNEFASQLAEFLRAASMIDEDWTAKELD